MKRTAILTFILLVMVACKKEEPPPPPPKPDMDKIRTKAELILASMATKLQSDRQKKSESPNTYKKVNYKVTRKGGSITAKVTFTCGHKVNGLKDDRFEIDFRWEDGKWAPTKGVKWEAESTTPYELTLQYGPDRDQIPRDIEWAMRN